MKPPSAQKEPDILQNYVYFSITSLDWTYQRWWRCLAKPAWPVYQNQDPLSSVCSNPGGLPKRRKVHHGPTPRHSIHFVYCERARWKLSRWACRQAGAPPPPPAPVTSLLQDGSLGRKGHSHLTKGREANDSPGPHSLANQRRGTRTQVSQAPVGLGLPTRRKPEPAALRAPAACLPTGGSTSGWKAALSEEGGRGHAAPGLPRSQPALRRPRGPEAETQGERSPEPSPPTRRRRPLTSAAGWHWQAPPPPQPKPDFRPPPPGRSHWHCPWIGWESCPLTEVLVPPQTDGSLLRLRISLFLSPEFGGGLGVGGRVFVFCITKSSRWCLVLFFFLFLCFLTLKIKQGIHPCALHKLENTGKRIF